MQKRITGYGFIALIIVGFVSLLSGCSPNSTTPDVPLKVGEMSANVSGFGSFFASNAVASDNSSYDVLASLKDQNNNDSVAIRMTITKQVLTPYTIDVSQDDNSKITFCELQSNGTCITYSADKLTTGSSGQIKITSISPSLQGTFSGTLKQVGGLGSVTITNGAFNAGF